MQIIDTRVSSIIFLIAIILCGCKSKNLTPEQYINWIHDVDNGLIKEETIGKVKYTIQYRPSDYQKAKSILSNDSFGLKHSKNSNHSFVIKMEPVDGKTQILTIDARDKDEPFQRINYYMSEAPQFMKLLEGNDTLNVESYIYERYYNASPAQNLVIGFHQIDKLGVNDLTFVLDDKVLNSGKIFFTFRKSILKNIPQLIH